MLKILSPFRDPEGDGCASKEHSSRSREHGGTTDLPLGHDQTFQQQQREPQVRTNACTQARTRAHSHTSTHSQLRRFIQISSVFLYTANNHF